MQAHREPDHGDSSVSRMKINHYMETDYAVTDILEWPGTPTHQRHLTAMEFLERNPSLLDKIEKEIIEETLGRNSQAGRDVFNLIGITMSSLFGRWAIDELVKQEIKSWHDSHELIELLTWKGSARRTIGTAINTRTDDRIDDSSLDLRTYIESEDPEVARMFILSFVKRVEVLGTKAIIHYTMPLPNDMMGGAKTTDTVKITKNGNRRESWLSPCSVGDEPSTTRGQVGRGPVPVWSRMNRPDDWSRQMGTSPEHIISKTPTKLKEQYQ